MNAKADHFSVVSFKLISDTYSVVHLKMSPGNERRGIMGIKATKTERRGETIEIAEGINRPAGVPLHAELSLKDGTGWVAYS